MVDSILITADLEREYEDLSGFYQRMLRFLRGVVQELEENGVTINRYKPPRWLPEIDVSKEPKFLTKLIGTMRELHLAYHVWKNDIVLHSQGIIDRSGLDESNPVWGDDLQMLAIGYFLTPSYLYKSHAMHTRDKCAILEAIEKAGLPIPAYKTIDDYLAGERELPVVLKAKKAGDGKKVYFIDREDQIPAFFDDDMYEGKAPSTSRYFVQRFVRTPSDRFTSYRIFTVGEKVIGAVLTVSKTSRSANLRQEAGALETMVDNPAGHLRCYPIHSNVSQGGFQLKLYIPGEGAHSVADPEHRQILIEHGYDPDNITLPEQLRDYAQQAGKELTRHGYVFAGQDWLQDREAPNDAELYLFLEAQSFPGFEIFRTMYGNKSRADNEAAAIQVLASALMEYEPIFDFTSTHLYFHPSEEDDITPADLAR